MVNFGTRNTKMKNLIASTNTPTKISPIIGKSNSLIVN
jgi:hypothetical protein